MKSIIFGIVLPCFFFLYDVWFHSVWKFFNCFRLVFQYLRFLHFYACLAPDGVVSCGFEWIIIGLQLLQLVMFILYLSNKYVNHFLRNKGDYYYIIDDYYYYIIIYNYQITILSDFRRQLSWIISLGEYSWKWIIRLL